MTSKNTTNNKGTCQKKKRKCCSKWPDTPVGAGRTLRLRRRLRSVCAGHSGVELAVRRFGGNSGPNSSNPWGNSQDWRLETQKDWEQLLKSRNPWTKTTRNSHDREIDPENKFGAFYEIFEFMVEKRIRGEILGNERLLIPICCGLATGDGPIFKDSQGYGWIRGGKGGERGVKRGTRRKPGETHAHTR